MSQWCSPSSLDLKQLSSLRLERTMVETRLVMNPADDMAPQLATVLQYINTRIKDIESQFNQ